ncbi:lisH and WD40 domain-containing protein mahjong isoform X2 [Brevipalpus obovatus]|uniref:lisH and WD40 domain-containing protein mahjong isoform X2 n=1 Tax=Brevipalpus obovatus TaxID=246614 RepID=UPI003D9E6CCA
MALVERNAVINEYLEQWETQFANSNNPLSGGSSLAEIIRKIAETVEEATEAYLKTDPDPFEDRHPCRARPDCALGHVLKNLFKNDAFTNKLVSCYVTQKEDSELQTQALRLFLDTLPGLEASVVFKETENLVNKLFDVAKGDREPARSYATGLLAAAMDVQEISDQNKDLNMQFVQICVKRLDELRAKQMKTIESSENQLNGTISDPSLEGSDNATDGDLRTTPKTLMMAPLSTKRVNENLMRSPKLKRRRVSSPCGVLSPQTLTSECSNSSWADIEPYMIGSFQMYPITPEMQQRYILQYLTPIMDYPEVFSYFYAHGAMSTMKHYINLEENHDIRVAFEALKCLSNLLCHKKFILEFLNTGGLELLLQVYRPSVAAEGVSICLLYLGYDEDAMEKICTFPRHLLSDMVSYALWLLECSHTSSRCNATFFLGLTFQFRIVLDIFDSKDGLRRLLNAIYLLNVFPENNPETEEVVVVNEDELITKKQAVRQVCTALKRYFEAHLVIEAENMRRSALPNSQSGARNGLSNTHMYKATHYTQETIYQHVENLLELMPLRLNWKPVDDLLKLGGLKLLINAIAKASSWGQFSGRSELIKNALDVLVVCSVTPKFQSALTEQVTIEGDIKKPPISVILSCATGSETPNPLDSEVKKSALHVIINCVCGPLHRIGDTIARLCSSSAKKSRSFRNGEDVLTKMWNCVRDNNGIIVLLNQLTVKTPISEADSIRALACKALCGLARSETVRQIISKLPLFTSGQLQTLMKEPVLQDKRTEHIKFCKSCLQLIESVTGSPLSTNLDTSPANIAKAEVVAQTKITYNEKELLLLIYQHLMAKGLKQSAAALQREASLPTSIAASSRTHSAIWTSPLAIKGSRSSLPSLPSISFQLSSTTGNALHGISTSSSAHPPSIVTSSITLSVHSTPAPSTSSQDRPSSQGTPSTIPMKIYRSNSNRPSPVQRNLSLQKPAQGSYLPSPILKRMDESHQISQPQLSITLDSIVTEYLRKQHALCKNPVVTCPPFDLFTPHRCPEPINRHNAPLNMALRVQRRETSPRFGGYFGTKFDRKFIYSRFRPFRTIRDLELGNATCCAFSYVDQHLFTGLYTGEMAVYNIHTGGLIATYPCHDTLVSYLEPSRDGKLILTGSDTYSGSTCSLWTYSDLFETKLEIQECTHCEFSKNIQNKMIVTSAHSATGNSNPSIAKLFDIPSTTVIREFEDKLSNRYLRNRATFNYTDELVLNDGVLWDIRSETPVHKFDKLNDHVNGVFHPNGWEMISNSEIWDLRNYHLLRTVSALDQCRIQFNKTGDIIYAAMYYEEENSEIENPYYASFRTFDATDYSNIATVDCKRAVADLAIDPGDNFIAVVDVLYKEENDTALFEYACRLYEVGCCKDEDDDDDDDDEEAIEDTDDDQPDNTDDFPQGSDASDGISVVSFEADFPGGNSEDDEYVTEPEDADEDDI